MDNNAAKVAASNNLNEDDEAFLYGGTTEDSIDNQNQNENTNSNQEDYLDYNDQNGKPNGSNSGDDKTNDVDENDEDINNLTNKVSNLDTNNQLNGAVDNEQATPSADAGSDSDDDDDEDDDGVNIVIDKIAKKTFTNQIATTNAPQVPKPVIQAKGVDLEAQGTINDIPTLEYDLQGIKDDDKPWRKPGADITDYFNYGFNEETWIAYCTKQRRLRAENAANKLNPALVNVIGAPNLPLQPMMAPINMQNAPNNIMVNHGAMPNQNFMQKQPVYPRPILQQQQQQRKMGQIDVIGSTDSTSRRPAYEHEINMQNHQISVLGNNNFQPHMPDLSAPPPGWMSGGGGGGPAPQVVQPIRMHGGPMQRMGHPMPINFPPYHFGPQGMQPMERPQNYGYMQPYVRNPVPQQSNQTWEKPATIDPFYPESGSPRRSRTRSTTPVDAVSKSPTGEKYKDGEQKKYVQSRGGERSAGGSGDHGRSGGGGGGERGSDHRSQSPRRSAYRSSHRDRDRRDRDRDRDRSDRGGRGGGGGGDDRQREKSRSRERSRSRSRDDKYKRSRRKSDSDDEHRSSRSHKRSKKSRKGRDSNERDAAGGAATANTKDQVVDNKTTDVTNNKND